MTEQRKPVVLQLFIELVPRHGNIQFIYKRQGIDEHTTGLLILKIKPVNGRHTDTETFQPFHTPQIDCQAHIENSKRRYFILRAEPSNKPVQPVRKPVRLSEPHRAYDRTLIFLGRRWQDTIDAPPPSIFILSKLGLQILLLT